MGRFLLYGSCAVIIIIAFWFYYQGEQLPDPLMPLVVFLLAVMFFGYGKKAQEDGDIGAGSSRIHWKNNPIIFQIILYFTYTVAGVLTLAAGYLLLN